MVQPDRCFHLFLLIRAFLCEHVLTVLSCLLPDMPVSFGAPVRIGQITPSRSLLVHCVQVSLVILSVAASALNLRVGLISQVNWKHLCG